MANSAVVGTLRAVLSADTAEFAVAMKQAGSAAEKAATDMMKGSAAFEAAGAKMASVTRLIKDFSGSLETRRAAEFAVAIEAIGGAAKLSESELRRANGVFSDFISKAQAMGKDVPAGIKKVADEVSRLANPASVGFLDQVKGSFSSLGPAALAAAGGFASALISVEALTQGLRFSIQFVKESVAQYLEAEKAQRKLAAALSAQSQATPETMRAYRDLADEFQRTTVFSDDLITEMQALLVQVGNVMPQDMEKALTAVTNLASGLGIDLRSATLMVAKAAEDNFTALKKLIPALDTTRAEAEGLDYILGLVNQKFGGQSQADMSSFSGQLTNMGNRFDELKEQIGEVIVESNLFGLVLKAISEQINEIERDLKLMKIGLQAMGTLPGPVGMAFKVLVGDLQQTKVAVQEVETGWQTWKRLTQQKIDSGALTDYSAKLKEIKDRLAELNPEQRQQIEAARQLGEKELKVVAERYGFTVKELSLLNEKTKEHKKEINKLEDAYKAWADAVTGAGLLRDLATLETRLARLTKEGGLSRTAMQNIAKEAEQLRLKGATLTPTLQSLVNQFIGFSKEVDDAAISVPKLNDKLDITKDELLEAAKAAQAVTKAFDDMNKIIGPTKGLDNLFKGGISGDDIKKAQEAILTFREKAAGAFLDVGNAFIRMGDAMGGESGQLISQIGGIAEGIGRLASGDVIGGIAQLTATLMSMKTAWRNIARDMQDAFATAELGFPHLNALMARLRELGAIDLVNRGDRAQRKDDEKETRAWMEDVRKFLAEVDRKAATLFGQLASAVQNFGGKAPAALQPLIQQLLTINSLTAEQRDLLRGLAGDPSWEDLQSIAQKYGIELGALGQKFQDARIGDIAMQYARDFMTLRDAGGDVNGLLIGMQDEVQALVNDARLFGTALPEAMRPVIEGLISMGLLTDANGNKFEDLASTGLSFTGTLEDAFKDMKSILEQIRDLLARGLPDAANKGADQIESRFRNFPTIRVPIEFDAGQFSPPSGFGVPQAATGGRITQDGLIYAHAGELVVPNDGEFSQPVRIDNRLYIDGREVTTAVIQHLREESRRLGIRPI